MCSGPYVLAAGRTPTGKTPISNPEFLIVAMLLETPATPACSTKPPTLTVTRLTFQIIKSLRYSRRSRPVYPHAKITPHPTGHPLTDPHYLPLTAQAAAVRAKEISPAELIDAHLARIAALNPKLNAFVSVDAEAARAAAKHATEALTSKPPTELGPLHGVPVSIKSSFEVAGWRAECGSALRRNYVASEDAVIVKRLRDAGAIPVGSTNVPEFLMAYETDNLLYGRTNNPWDVERTPGGSSGGEAAAIAAGLSAGGIGSDGGGSIRIPAHYSGICGLKPTPGRIPGTGQYPASAGPFTQMGVVGPLARTVADLRALFDVIAGPDNGDPASAPVPVAHPNEAEIKKLHVAYFEDDGVTPVTEETAAAVRAAAEALRAQGFTVTQWRPRNLDRVWQLWWNLFGRGVQMAFAPTVEGREAELSPIYTDFRATVSAQPPLTAQELMNTLLGRDALRAMLLEKMEQFPILICPACAIPAFRHRERKWNVRGKDVEYLKAMSYSQWWNILGNPAVVVPFARSLEGLPIGVQLVGRPWREEEVLGVAGFVEAAGGGFRRPRI
jgi:Asp-tRNA(Asn)/Glu-tRNA(Gln) amidotransferase A subunit family amidase